MAVDTASVGREVQELVEVEVASCHLEGRTE